MKTAFAFGADAVYLGVPEYSLRSRINEFTPARIKEACAYAHKLGKKVYATINIIAHESDFKKLSAHIKVLKNAKVDGVIISDPGVLAVVKKNWPRAKIHLSTQANCLNSESVKFWQANGIRRIVLGRETTLEDIKKIKKAVLEIELEYFVHGAMCMAYSGRCFLSKYLTDRSANSGDCIQPCRWKQEVKSIKFPPEADPLLAEKVKSELQNTKILVVPDGTDVELLIEEDERGSYIFNSKDLCLIEHLDELMKAGVTSFKIEGRTKSAYYVATVVGAYAKVLRNLKNKSLPLELKKELEEKVYNRGFTDGFLFGDGGMEQETKFSHQKSDWEFCGEVKSKKLKVKSKKENTCMLKSAPLDKFKAGPPALIKRGFTVLIKVHNTIRAGEEVEIVRPEYDIMKMKIIRMTDTKTGEEVSEAHGGKGQVVMIESGEFVPEFSVVRRLAVPSESTNLTTNTTNNKKERKLEYIDCD
jgi:U32 family peptidase